MIPDEQLLPLIMGGEITSHSHPYIISLDDLHRMQQLEKMVYAFEDYSAQHDDDYIFVNTANGPVTITLYEALFGQHVTVSRIDGTNPVTVVGQSGQTINLQPSATITDSFKPLRLKAVKELGYLEI